MRSSVCRAAILGFVVGAVAAPAAQLGEIARQEEARRKTVASAGKVYTNGSLRPEPQPPAGAAATSPTPPSPQAEPAPAASENDAKASAPAPAPAPAKDEAYWRKRLSDAREALQRAQAFQAALESQINGLTTEFISRDDPAQRSAVAANRDKALAELDRVRKEVQQHTKTVGDIQEEARREGVPAGWVR